MFQANLAHSCGIAAQRTQCGFSSSRTRSKLPFKSQLHQRFDSEPGEPLERQPSRWGGRVQTLEAVSPRWLGRRPPCQWGIAFSSSHCNQAKPRITQLCPAHPQRNNTGLLRARSWAPSFLWAAHSALVSSSKPRPTGPVSGVTQRDKHLRAVVCFSCLAIRDLCNLFWPSDGYIQSLASPAWRQADKQHGQGRCPKISPKKKKPETTILRGSVRHKTTDGHYKV